MSELQSLKVLVIASAVIVQDGKILLIQESYPDFYKKWNLPGGRVDEGEDLLTAAKRETREEAGVDVEIDKELLLMHTEAHLPVLHAFTAHIVGGEPHSDGQEILDVRWVPLGEVMQQDLRNPDYMQAILKALNN